MLTEYRLPLTMAAFLVAAPAAADTEALLRECRAIPDSSVRLSCFDDLVDANLSPAADGAGEAGSEGAPPESDLGPADATTADTPPPTPILPAGLRWGDSRADVKRAAAELGGSFVAEDAGWLFYTADELKAGCKRGFLVPEGNLLAIGIICGFPSRLGRPDAASIESTVRFFASALTKRYGPPSESRERIDASYEKSVTDAIQHGDWLYGRSWSLPGLEVLLGLSYEGSGATLLVSYEDPARMLSEIAQDQAASGL